MKRYLRKACICSLFVILLFCLAGCSGNQNNDTQDTQSPKTYSVGEAVETDIVKFTLNRAELAIALNPTVQDGSSKFVLDSFLMPKEYDPTEDSKNPFVAAKGHTLVPVTFTAENLDRTSTELTWGLENLLAISFGGTTYRTTRTQCDILAENQNDNGWKSYSVANILLVAGEKSSYKAFIGVPFETEELNSPFEVIVTLPNANGDKTEFTYTVN